MAARDERGGRNRIGRREKWPKKSWEKGEIGGKSREEGENVRQTFREEGEIGSKSREKGDLLPCSSPLMKETQAILTESSRTNQIMSVPSSTLNQLVPQIQMFQTAKVDAQVSM